MGRVIGYQETHGSVATFETDVAGKIKKLEASIEPIQDLHGYDSPWPAGGGKNKLQVTATSQTINGVTFTVNDDGTITASGTATANIVFTIAYIDFASGSYLLNGTPSGGSTSTYFIRVYNSNTQTSINSTASDASFTAENGFNRVDIRVLNGVTVNDLVFKPMIRLESETDATFAPYSNICPITGWTGAKVSRTSINLWDEEWEVGSISADTGENIIIQSQIRTRNFIPVKPGMSVFIVSPNQGSDNIAGNLKGRYYNKDKQYLGSNPAMRIGKAITIPKDCYYVRFGTQTIYGSSYSHDISINYPSTDMQYHAYQGDTYDIAFPFTAGTVYGGTLDIVNGTLTLTHKGGFFNDLYSSGLNTMTTNASDIRRWGLPKSMFDGIANAASNNRPEDFLCSAYKTISAADSFSRNNGVSVTQNGLVVIFDENYSDKATTTNSGAVAYFSDINPFFVWKLATPITYQLTPQEINTIIGTNTIFADSGDTTVYYPKSFIPVETYSDVDLLNMRRNIIASQPHIESIDGPIVSFGTDIVSRFTKCEVEIEAAQSGAGDPSVDNVRSITGWTGVNITVNGSTISITFPSAAGTVYGGKFNATTGKLIIDGRLTSITGDSVDSYYTASSGMPYVKIILPEGYYADPNKDYLIKADKYKTITTMGTLGNPGIRTIRTACYIYDEHFTSLSAARTYLNSNPVQLVYYLENKAQFQLDPVDMSFINDTNTLYADCGGVSVSYFTH